MQEELNTTPDINPEQDSAFTFKPTMVYDGNCGFCRYWVSRWQRNTINEVTYIPYQQIPKLYNGITRRQFSKSVYLITKYRRLRGAAAVFEVLALGGNNFWNSVYYNVVLADVVFEAGYQFIAANRNFFFKLTKLFYKEARLYDTQAAPPYRH